jgi:hypothetical protein
MQRWFRENDSRCEWPACKDDPQPAEYWYQTMWSFVWLCGEHFEFTETLHDGPPNVKLMWDKKLAEFMYSKLLVFSYVHTNAQSGGALEAAIDARNEAAIKLGKAEQRAPAQARRETRAAIKASDIKIGSPDDDLVTSRGRQIQRKRSGAKQLGPSSSAGLTVLRAKLTVPTAHIIPEENE